MRRIVTILPILIVLAIPTTSRAGHDTKRTLEFLGFSDDAARYLVKVVDADTGEALSVRSTATGKAEKTIPIEDRAAEKAAIDGAKRSFRITDAGQDAQQSPDGKYMLLLVPKGLKVELRVMRGERRAVLKALDARPGPEGPQKMILKSVFWSRDGRRIVVIVHRTQRGENGVDADEAHPFDFLPGELQFEGG
jgi:hypothetical protein